MNSIYSLFKKLLARKQKPIHTQVKSLDAESFARFLEQNKDQVDKIISESILTNSRVRSIIKKTP